MTTLETNTKHVTSQDETHKSNRLSKYMDVFEFVTSNIFLVGAYFLGYHHYSIFYLTIPSIVTILPRFVIFCNRKRLLRAKKKRNHSLQNDFPTESAEWINQFFNHLWPCLDDIAQSWIMKKLHKIGLKVLKDDKHRFKINSVNCGLIPPTINDIKVTKSSSHGSDSMTHIDVNISHESDATVELSYFSFTSTIRKICWNGIVRISLNPISLIAKTKVNLISYVKLIQRSTVAENKLNLLIINLHAYISGGASKNNHIL